MKCNTCQNEDYCYDGNHEITRYGCADNGFAAYVPQTNADRIRAMSDEELAKLFVSGWYDGPLFTCPVEDVECESDVSCDVCFLEWLKAPAEVGEG